MVVLNVDRLAASSSTVASFYSSPASLLLSHPVLHITNRKLKLHHWSALLCSFGIERNGNVTLGHQRTSYILTEQNALITFSLLLCIISTIQIWSYFQIHPSFCFSIDTLCTILNIQLNGIKRSERVNWFFRAWIWLGAKKMEDFKTFLLTLFFKWKITSVPKLNQNWALYYSP